MTVSSQTNNETFHGNGVTTVWDLPFRFFSNSDIFAYRVDPITSLTTLLVQGTDYTLTGEGLPEQFGTAPGKIITSVAFPTGKDLYVERVMPVEQLTDIVNQGRFFPEVHEDVFDRLTMFIQQSFSTLINALMRPLGKNYYDALGNRIINLGNPIDPTDAANLQSVNNAVAGEAFLRQEGDASLQAQITGGTPPLASAFSPISWHGQEITNSVTIPPDKNAWSFGPTMQINLGVLVTISPGSFWTIANGATSGDGTLTPQLPNPLDLNV